MRKNKIPKKYIGKWVLINKDNKVIFSSDNVADVVKKGREFPYNDVLIEKKQSKDYLSGLTDNYIRVEVKGDSDLVNTFQKVKLKNIENNIAMGSIISG